MYLLDTFWIHCLRNHNEITMYLLNKCPLSPSVFRFAIGAAADIRDRVARRVQQQGQDRIVGDPQIHRLLMLGVFDWTGDDIFRGGQNFPSLAFRYSCVLGNSLLKRIERSDAEVRLQIYRSTLD